MFKQKKPEKASDDNIEKEASDLIETSLLRRLQAQTLPDATPPIRKIYPFIKMAVTVEPVMQF